VPDDRADSMMQRGRCGFFFRLIQLKNTIWMMLWENGKLEGWGKGVQRDSPTHASTNLLWLQLFNPECTVEIETALGRFNPDLGTRCALMILAAGESSSGMLTG